MVPSGWDELLAEPAELTFERVPFDHPLWVLYSSGTTGLPKAIVQGQGGILLEHLKKARLHSDLSPGDRFFWFTTTGWMMWNFLVGGLLAGRHDRAVRRPAGPGAAVGLRGRGARHDVRHERRVHRRVDEGGGHARAVGGAARGGVDRLAAAGRGLRVGVRALPRRVALLDQRRHRPVHGVRGRLPAAAGVLGRAAGTLPGRVGGGVERGRAPAGERGGRARDHEADAVDADLLLGRPGRRALPVELLRDVPGRVAARGLDQDHRSRHGGDLRAVGLDDQPRRRAHGHERDLQRGRGSRRRCSTAWWWTSRTR